MRHCLLMAIPEPSLVIPVPMCLPAASSANQDRYLTPSAFRLRCPGYHGWFCTEKGAPHDQGYRYTTGYTGAPTFKGVSAAASASARNRSSAPRLVASTRV